MENLKIKVNNETESKEVQGLFFQLGFTWSGHSTDIFEFATPEYIVNWDNGYITIGDDFYENRKEVTLQELRDMISQDQEDPFVTPECIIGDQCAEIEAVQKKHSHYKKDVSNLQFIDVYRVLSLFEVVDPCLQHAIKKLLCSGQRGVKSVDKDIQEAIDSLLRYQEMREEDLK